MDDLHDAIYKIFFGDDRQPSEEAAKFTEAQWPEAGDPRLLLDFLRDKISNRQLNLFAVACCRRAWQLLTRPSQAAIEATERFVDGYLSDEQQGFAALAAIDTEVGIMVHQMDAPRHNPQDAALVQRLSAAATAVTYGLCPAPVIGTYTPDTPEQDRGMMALVSHITVAITGRASDPTEFRVQADFLRDIVGNPFHPFVLDPSWQTPTVISLAQAIYAERAFDRMPMLADALEESGCAHEDILWPVASRPPAQPRPSWRFPHPQAEGRVSGRQQRTVLPLPLPLLGVRPETHFALSRRRQPGADSGVPIL